MTNIEIYFYLGIDPGRLNDFLCDIDTIVYYENQHFFDGLHIPSFTNHFLFSYDINKLIKPGD